MNVVVVTALGTQFCCYCDNGMHVYVCVCVCVCVCFQSLQEREHTLAAHYITRYTATWLKIEYTHTHTPTHTHTHPHTPTHTHTHTHTLTHTTHTTHTHNTHTHTHTHHLLLFHCENCCTIAAQPHVILTLHVLLNRSFICKNFGDDTRSPSTHVLCAAGIAITRLLLLTERSLPRSNTCFFCTKFRGHKPCSYCYGRNILPAMFSRLEWIQSGRVNVGLITMNKNY